MGLINVQPDNAELDDMTAAIKVTGSEIMMWIYSPLVVLRTQTHVIIIRYVFTLTDTSE